MQVEHSLVSIRAACRTLAETGVEAGWPATASGLLSVVRRAKQRQAPDSKAHGRKLLTDAQEIALEGLLLALSHSQSSLESYSSVAEAALDILKAAAGGGAAGAAAVEGVLESSAAKSTFGKRFVEERPSLVRRLGKQLTRNRRTFLKAEIAGVLDNAEKSGDAALGPHQIANMDECRMIVTGSDVRVINSRDIPRHNAAGTRDQHFAVTYVPVAFATGKVWMEFIILKGKPDKESEDELDFILDTPTDPNDNDKKPRLRGQPIRYYLVSKSGFSNQVLFSKMLRLIGKHWSDENPGLKLALWIDNASVHKATDSICDVFNEFLVNVRFFAPNTTHFWQPLDRYFFAVLKKILKKIGRLVEHSAAVLSVCASGYSAITAYAAMAEVVELAPKLLQADFAETGVFPWNRAKVEELADLYHEEMSEFFELEAATSLTVKPAVAMAAAAAAVHVNAAREAAEKFIPTAEERAPLRMNAGKAYSGQEMAAMRRDRIQSAKEAKEAKETAAAEAQAAKEAKARDKEKQKRRRSDIASRKERRSKCFVCDVKRHAHGVLCSTCQARWACNKCNGSANSAALTRIESHQKHCIDAAPEDSEEDQEDDEPQEKRQRKSRSSTGTKETRSRETALQIRL